MNIHSISGHQQNEFNLKFFHHQHHRDVAMVDISKLNLPKNDFFPYRLVAAILYFVEHKDLKYVIREYIPSKKKPTPNG